jgi:hypothetical protein
MALQTFTAGQVLTAAQVNALQANDYNQTVSTKTDSYTLVAADKGTRVEMNAAGATTITVNTDLFNAGDTLFIQNRGAGVCTITAGTATVSTTGSLALVQNAGGTLYFISAGVAVFYASGVVAASGGLTFITGASFTTATSVSLPNDTFTSAYRNYKIILNVTSCTTDADFSVRLRASGADNTTSNYMSMLFGVSTTGTTTGLVQSLASSWSAAETDNGAGNVRYAWNFDILQPQIAQQTFMTGHLTYVNKANTLQIGQSGNQNFLASTQFDSLSFISSVASSITGAYRVYGYSES